MARWIHTHTCVYTLPTTCMSTCKPTNRTWINGWSGLQNILSSREFTLLDERHACSRCTMMGTRVQRKRTVNILGMWTSMQVDGVSCRCLACALTFTEVHLGIVWLDCHGRIAHLHGRVKAPHLCINKRQSWARQGKKQLSTELKTVHQSNNLYCIQMNLADSAPWRARRLGGGDTRLWWDRVRKPCWNERREKGLRKTAQQAGTWDDGTLVMHLHHAFFVWRQEKIGKQGHARASFCSLERQATIKYITSIRACSLQHESSALHLCTGWAKFTGTFQDWDAFFPSLCTTSQNKKNENQRPFEML